MIDVDVSADTTTLTVAGDLDLAGRDRFDEVSARVRELDRRTLIVDLCRTTFVDSTGAAFLMSLAAGASDRRSRPVLRGADPSAMFVLEICGALALYDVDRDHRCDEDAAGQEGAR